MPRENDALLRYARRPSRRRLAGVVRAYQDFLWSVAHRISGNREDAADICQDVFLELLLAPPSPDAIRSPGAYLAWHALGRAQFLRRARERQEARERRFAEDLVREKLDEVREPEGNLVRQALAELPRELRDAVELRYLAGLSPRSSAEALGISERALYQRLEKARVRLKRRLAPAVVTALFVSGLETALSAPPRVLTSRLLDIASRGSALSGPSSAVLPTFVGGVRGRLRILVFAWRKRLRHSINSSTPSQNASHPKWHRESPSSVRMSGQKLAWKNCASRRTKALFRLRNAPSTRSSSRALTSFRSRRARRREAAPRRRQCVQPCACV